MKPYRVWGCLLAMVFMGVAHAQTEFADERLPFQSAEAKKVIARLNQDDFQGGLAEAKRLAAHAPASLELLMLTGMVEAQLGNYEQALTAFENGIRGGEADLPFLIMASRLHATRGELGPTGAQINGMVRFTPDKRSPEERAAFIQREYVAAADCLAKAIALRPTRVTYQVRRVDFLVKGKAAEAALAATEEYLKASPNQAELWIARAQAAVSLKRWADAESAAQRCLELRPGAPEAYTALAAVAEQAKNSGAADGYRRRAAFHQYVRPAYAVPYSDERYAIIEAVSIGQTQRSDAEQKQWREHAVATIERLKGNRSDESNRMLAAICWHHAFHGAIEDAMFAELEARKAEPLLRALLQDANSVCTVGSCALALARLRSDEGFKLIADRLPADRNTFPMNIPEALAIYGRPECVPMLAFALQDAITSWERESENVMLMMGTGAFVRRCVWALAQFKDPAATAALEKAAKSKTFATEATAALFLQTRKPEHRDQMLALLKKDPSDAEWVARRLKAADIPDAAEVQAIADKYNAAKSASKAGRKQG